MDGRDSPVPSLRLEADGTERIPPANPMLIHV
jgi:hypothetical protein